MSMTTEENGQLGRRHCMVVHAYYPLGETRVQREAMALLVRGMEVDVIALRKPGDLAFQIIDGVEVHRLPVQRHKGSGLGLQMLEYLAFFMLAFFRLSRLHLAKRYQVIQVHNLPDFLVFVGLIPKMMGARIILDLHDLMPEFYTGWFGDKRRRWLLQVIRWQEKLSCRFADHVITVSEHWRQALIRRGVAEKKCSVVMNVADDNIFATNGAAPRPASNGEFRLLYHGTITYRYGLDLAIRAIALVKEEIPDVHLTLLGKGDYVPDLIDLVQELELGAWVTIHHELRPAEELPDIIRAADVGVVPYRDDVFTDGLLPTKLMEYAAMGLPAIAARTTGIETYFGGTMVEFFEPGDVDDLARCIHSLYGNPERLKALAKGSEKFNERYNWTKLGAEYASLVQGLAGR